MLPRVSLTQVEKVTLTDFFRLNLYFLWKNLYFIIGPLPFGLYFSTKIGPP